MSRPLAGARRPHLRRRVIVGLAAAGLMLSGCSASATSTDTGGVQTDSSTTSSASGTDASSTSGSGLFDNSTVHFVSLSYDDAAYQAMIAAYTSTGEKQWMTASVTIDGTLFDNVGIKLKGNSTLQGLRGDSRGAEVVGTVSTSEPESLPWRIRLDKYVDGQNFQGATDIVVRGGRTETSMNEAVALELIGHAGLATEEATPTRFSVNGGTATLRLVIQNPNDEWAAENFDGDGILYKAEAQGDYSYRGDDPTAYADVFEIEASSDENADNFAPLITFLKFLDESDDATFASQLGNYLDVQSFADYLAIQDLVANFDDIAGPGNNSYLRYDVATQKLTVVSWDQNLSFSEMGFGGGAPPAGMAPGGAPGAGQRGPNGNAPGAGQAPVDGTAQQPAGQAPVDGTAQQPAGQQGGMGGMGGMGGNVLAERFKADSTFTALYEEAKTNLQATLYSSGAAQQILDGWTSVLLDQATDLVSADTIRSEAGAIAKYFTAG